MRILLAGDTHGNTDHFTKVLFPAATEYGCGLIVQLGDFGWWPHSANGIKFASAVSHTATRVQIPVWWLDGNHENFDSLYDYDGTRGDHPVQLLPSLYYLPRGCSFELGGIKFVALGGAFSIDRDYRLQVESQNRQPRSLLWYPDEMTADIDVDKAIANGKGAAVMLTHDAPTNCDITALTRFKLPDELTALSTKNREQIQRAVDNIKPQRLYHGHYHANNISYIDGIRIECLNCDGTGPNSWTILDTQDLQ